MARTIGLGKLIRLPPLSVIGIPIVAIGTSGITAGVAQEGLGYIRLPEAREIALARSAAPMAVSEHATVWVLRGGNYIIAVKGTSGSACIVSRTWPTSIEPICYDPEGARTLLPIEIRLVETRIAGGDRARAQAVVDEGIANGVFPLPNRPVMAYMLSSAQRLVADDGREVGSWRPHYMLYVPHIRARDIGLTGPSADVFVANEGKPLAHIITVAPAFVDPVPER